jgi:hypothetical protein
MKRELNKLAYEKSTLSSNALCYAQQIRGIVCAELDLRVKDNDEQAWRFSALLTLACLACDELEKATSMPVCDEVKS